MEGLGDFTGRSLGRLRNTYPRKLLTLLLIARLLLIPTSFLMAFNDTGFWAITPIVMLNCLILGLSNGFVGVAACNSFPSRLENHEKEFGGTVLSLMINLGISIGSLISLLAF